MDVSTAVASRYSCRAFRPDPVPKELLKELLGKALQAPSGGNLQPWRVIALTGDEKDKLSPIVQAALFQNPKGEEGEFPVYPSGLQEPWRSRRFKVGEDLYASLGIPREDKAARYAWLAKNFEWFGAPVGLFFVTHRSFGHGQWAHMGMLMQTFALLATCMQEAWAMVRETLREPLSLGEDEILYCGMSVGYADDKAPVNGWRSERADFDDIFTLKGF